MHIPAACALDGKFSLAVRSYEEQAREQELNPFSGEADHTLLYRTGEACENNGDHEKAIRCFREFLAGSAMDTLAVNAYLALGAIEKNRGDTRLSTAYFNEAAKPFSIFM